MGLEPLEGLESVSRTRQELSGASSQGGVKVPRNQTPTAVKGDQGWGKCLGTSSSQITCFPKLFGSGKLEGREGKIIWEHRRAF